MISNNLCAINKHSDACRTIAGSKKAKADSWETWTNSPDEKTTRVLFCANNAEVTLLQAVSQKTRFPNHGLSKIS